jgi:O-acetyl-ADP-ribose deacetylase
VPFARLLLDGSGEGHDSRAPAGAACDSHRGPGLDGRERGEDELLAACHASALTVAAELGSRTVAFPAISTGIFRFPVDRAARIAIATTADELERWPSIERVTFVLFDRDSYDIFAQTLARGI